MIRMLALAAVLLFAPVTLAQDAKDNPFKKAKVGDYLAYKMTTSVMGKDFDVTMKQTITAITEKEATLKSQASTMGFDLPAQETKIDLTKPYDPAAAVNQGKKGKAKFEKISEGKEKITVNGKSYDCNWISGKLSGEAKGLNIASEVKIWFSPAVPMSGLVKMEMKSNIANVKMELSESGSAK